MSIEQDYRELVEAAFAIIIEDSVKPKRRQPRYAYVDRALLTELEAALRKVTVNLDRAIEAYKAAIAEEKGKADG
jgi:hypothetical protein